MAKEIIGCRKGITQGFHSFICGNNYSGKQFICSPCKAVDEAETKELTLNKQDLIVMLGAFEEIALVSLLKESEEALKTKVRRILKEFYS
jgi:hypothetical protein